MRKGWKVGDICNGCPIIARDGDVFTLRCGRCEREFTKTRNKMEYETPKSCGCAVRAAFEKRMKMCFPRRPVFYGPKTKAESKCES